MTGPTLRVLIIEDNENDADLILLELKRANGFELEHERVDNEQDFKKALNTKIWDLFIVDYSMPNFSAERVLQLREGYHITTPVILVTGTITEEQSNSILGRNVIGYVDKRNLSGLGFLFRYQVDLSRGHDELIEMYTDLLGMRDHETEQHTKRVTELTIRLAEKMGISAVERTHMELGAKMHDIGKAAIPDSILLKQGPLTDEERYVMQRHPLIAFDKLSRYERMQHILDIPYCHHERWDGHGYPRGLSGEDIPFAARIFSVVDCYDAMTSDRPYRAALSVKEVLSYIAEQSGRMFDPQVVDAFLRMQEEDVE